MLLPHTGENWTILIVLPHTGGETSQRNQLKASMSEKPIKSQHGKIEIQTHGPHFSGWYYEFSFCSYVLQGEKELDWFTRKTSKGRFLLLFVWADFLFAGSKRPTKTWKTE